MIDIVYVLGSGSQWGNNEIMYSICSVKKHLKGSVGNVYVIGKYPHVKTPIPIIHVGYEDGHKCKERNIFSKILAASDISDISDTFLFMNDDHYLLSDFDIASFPYFKRKCLNSAKASSFQYNIVIRNTESVLKLNGKKTEYFDVHTPILYEKEKIRELSKLYNWELKHTYVIKSLYCNSFDIEGTEIEQDVKFNNTSYLPFDKWVQNKLLFSTSDFVSPEVRKFMQEYYL